MSLKEKWKLEKEHLLVPPWWVHACCSGLGHCCAQQPHQTVPRPDAAFTAPGLEGCGRQTCVGTGMWGMIWKCLGSSAFFNSSTHLSLSQLINTVCCICCTRGSIPLWSAVQGEVHISGGAWLLGFIGWGGRGIYPHTPLQWWFLHFHTRCSHFRSSWYIWQAIKTNIEMTSSDNLSTRANNYFEKSYAQGLLIRRNWDRDGIGGIRDQETGRERWIQSKHMPPVLPNCSF